MRLLELSPSGQAVLTADLRDKDLPAYAILSHTWGSDSEEVTFKDLTSNVGKHKSGFNKIRFCARQANYDGLRYIWVDSCCIDNSNHTELHEAINSMFRWYQRAQRCYVYLSDVSANEHQKLEQQPDSVWGGSFLASRWFTRGWTLQELLAPASVEFFSKEGWRLGNKKSLEAQIHSVSGIAVPALRNPAGFAQFSVEERFEWAEKRQTTREEDWAYCLLGIFGIFLPLLYGEGRDNAIRRLKKEIVGAVSGDATPDARAELLAWVGGPQDTSGPISVPFPGTGEWLLNTDEYQSWASCIGPQILWCYGAPGVGKTVLASVALESLTLCLEEQPVCLLRYFCDFANRKIQKKEAIWKSLLYQAITQAQGSTLKSVLKSRGRLRSSRAPSSADLQGILRAICGHEKVVVFFDGLDELEHVRDVKAILSPFIGSNCRMLVTSRDLPEIRSALCTAAVLKAETTNDDLKAYLTGQFEENGLEDVLETNPGLEAELVSRSNGIFLLARILADRLIELSTAKEMRKALQSHPVHLNEAFGTSLDRIKAQSDSHRTLAYRVMAWLVAAERKLRMAELIHGLAVDQSSESIDDENLLSSKTILKVCCGLVAENSQDGTVTMVHATVYDWFHSHNEMKYHEDIAKTCLHYLTLQELSSGMAKNVSHLESRMSSLPFLSYAASYWREHIHGDSMEIDLWGTINKLLDTTSFRSATFQVLNYKKYLHDSAVKAAAFESMSFGHSSLHVAAYFNLRGKTSDLLKNGADANARDSQEWTPLHWACFKKSATTIDLLVLHGADLNAKDSVGWTPIFWSVLHGDKYTVEQLLKNDANHLVRDVHGWTVLRWAVARQQTEIIGSLLQHHSTCLKNLNKTALLKTLTVPEALRYWAVNKEEELIDTLVDNESESKYTNEEGANLYSILEDQSFDTTSLWNSGHFDPPIGNMWRTMTKGEFNVDKYMNRITMESRGGAGWKERLLYAAIRAERLLEVKFIVGLGAEINESKPRSALHTATFRQNPEIAEFLIDHGANLESTDNQGVTPLQQAVMNGFESIVQVLLSRGANVNAVFRLNVSNADSWRLMGKLRASGSKTPLMLACGLEESPEDPMLAPRIMRLLIHSGADVDMSDEAGLTAIHYAAYTRNPDILGPIVNSGAHLEARDNMGGTAIHHLVLGIGKSGAKARFDLEEQRLPGKAAACLDLFLQNCELDFASQDAIYASMSRRKNKTSSTPLALSIILGDWELFDTLYRIGARFQTEANISDSIIDAARALKPDALDLLLANGAVWQNRMSWENINWIQEMRIMSSSNKIQPGDLSKLILVLAKLQLCGFEMNETDDHNNTILHKSVVCMDSFEVTRALLEAGADPFLQTADGLDGFLLAGLHGNYGNLQCLLQHAPRPWPENHWIHHIDNDKLANATDLPAILCQALDTVQVLNNRLEHTMRCCTSENLGTLLYRAANLGNSSFLSALIQQGADTAMGNYRGVPPLQIAASQGHVLCVDALIDAGVDVNACDQDGLTPLHLAALSGKLQVVQTLLSNGACVNSLDREGWQPLHFAALADKTEACLLLIALGASTTTAVSHWTSHNMGDRKRPSGLRQGDGWTGTMLHLAAMNGNGRVVQALLADENTNANARSDNFEGERVSRYNDKLPVPGAGPTALHMALDTGTFYLRSGNKLDRGRLESASLLINCGAEVEGVANHLCLRDVIKFQDFPELWDKLRVGING